MQPSYDLSSDHSPIIITLSTTVADRTRPLRLHTFKTDWNTYKTTIAEKLNTKKKLKTKEDIEAATTELISIIQQAAKIATPLKNYPAQVNNLPSHIKQLVAQKRRARATWQSIIHQRINATITKPTTNSSKTYKNYKTLPLQTTFQH